MNCNLWVLAILCLTAANAYLLWKLHGLSSSLTRLEQLLATTPLQQVAVKPLPSAGTTYTLSDAEMAAREKRLTADSRQRAHVAAQDAHQKWTQMFRPGSPS